MSGDRRTLFWRFAVCCLLLSFARVAQNFPSHDGQLFQGRDYWNSRYSLGYPVWSGFWNNNGNGRVQYNRAYFRVQWTVLWRLFLQRPDCYLYWPHCVSRVLKFAIYCSFRNQYWNLYRICLSVSRTTYLKCLKLSLPILHSYLTKRPINKSRLNLMLHCRSLWYRRIVKASIILAT